ncbi:MAG: hypothetical protein HYY38_03155, partial [Rhodospirillales bacterium]|nr:hypothetical protein [Rhodospirillales bacterium]
MHTYLEFEKPIAELEGKIEELRHVSGSTGVDVAGEVAKLQSRLDKLLVQIYAKLTPWQKTLVARHHDRPHAMDYIAGLIEDFTPLAGDRQFADDDADQRNRERDAGLDRTRDGLGLAARLGIDAGIGAGRIDQ